MVFCDLANRIRNSALFHPFLYFMFGATLYYTWSLTSQNSELLEKLNTVNFALSETNKDLSKTNMKLKMCQSKETSYSISNKDLQTRLSSCETQTGEINEDLDSEKKAKQKFLLDFEVLLNSLMSDPNNILKIGSLDSVLENMEIFKNKYNEQTESKKKEIYKLQDDKKVTTGRLEEELKFFSTQNEVLQKKLQESSAFIASLKNQVDELKFQQKKVTQERGLKLRKEDNNNNNVRMINLNDQKLIQTVPVAPINPIQDIGIRPERVLTTLATIKTIPTSTVQQEKPEEEDEVDEDKDKEENKEKGKVDETTTSQNQKRELNRAEETKENEIEESKNFEKSTEENSVNKKDDAVQDEDGADENNEKNDKSLNIDKNQNNENEEDDNN
ncbi:glutamic acid-rich protein-like [Hydra vulgaris]|uniref:Glutamic acid-rich protein-like n=1 Tax=Hydra vulgaris TaxID=6087 RepID=A0ABM4DEP8_HYDVU